MIKKFYDWLTYNPANIPITNLIRPIAFELIIIVIIMCVFCYVLSEKVSFKTIIGCFFIIALCFIIFFVGNIFFK